MKSWYKIINKTADTASVSIHNEIGLFGVSAAQFIGDLRAQSAKTIDLSIHSPGGNLLDGFAMYNALLSHPAKVYGRVEGIAASAASLVLMAADMISMPEDSFIMIHNPHGGAYGQSSDLREMADIMDKMQSSIANIYAKRTGLDSAEIIDMLNAETWMSAADAQQKGFADHVIDKIGVAAKASGFDKYFHEMPFAVESNVDGIKTERDFEAALRDVGVSRSKATAMVAKAKTVFKGDPVNGGDSNQLAELSSKLGQFSFPTFKVE